MAESSLSQARLKELLDYDSETGLFVWKVLRGGKAQAGRLAGYPHSVNGYWIIEILDCSYMAHRLAWLYVNGEWPKQQIDHINRDRADNRLCNLRDVSPSQNKANCEAYSGRSQKGVYQTKCSTWAAAIRFDRKLHYLGTFKTPEAAAFAYQKKFEELRGHRG